MDYGIRHTVAARPGGPAIPEFPHLPQAKIYNGSCALGQANCLAMPEDLGNLPIHLELRRGGTMVFARETTTAKMKRTPAELVAYLTHELEFPQGVFLMTGTGIVPGDNFSSIPDDEVHIQMGSAIIRNHVL